MVERAQQTAPVRSGRVGDHGDPSAEAYEASSGANDPLQHWPQTPADSHDAFGDRELRVIDPAAQQRDGKLRAVSAATARAARPADCARPVARSRIAHPSGRLL